MLKLISGLFGLFTRLWDFFMSPKKQEQRARAEADKAVETHDNKSTNEILDRNS